MTSGSDTAQRKTPVWHQSPRLVAASFGASIVCVEASVSQLEILGVWGFA
jgi:hypothetical protein